MSKNQDLSKKKKKEAGTLGLKTLLKQKSLIRWCFHLEIQNEWINKKLLLARDKFMPQMRLMKSLLQDNDTEIYSTYNEGKSVTAEKFIRTLKNNASKYVTSVSKNVHIDKLDEILEEYNNACHKTIKMKLVDMKSRAYIDFGVANNDNDTNL